MQIQHLPVMHPELQILEDGFRNARADAESLVAGLTDEQAAWRPDPGTWSVAECVEHLAITNQIYLRAMQPVADQARRSGRMRRGAALPGFFGEWFVRSLEPPAKIKTKAPKLIKPRAEVRLGDAVPAFFSSHDTAQAFLAANADLDLASILFPNPFVKGLRFSLATGLHAIPAHERRHLYQAKCMLTRPAQG
jgi:hypothetical protein